MESAPPELPSITASPRGKSVPQLVEGHHPFTEDKGKRNKRGQSDLGTDAVPVLAAEKKRRTTKTGKVAASVDQDHDDKDNLYAPEGKSEVEPCSRIRYRPLSTPASAPSTASVYGTPTPPAVLPPATDLSLAASTPSGLEPLSSSSDPHSVRQIRYYCPLYSLPPDTSLRPLPLVLIGVVSWLHTHASIPKQSKYTVMRLGVPGSTAYIYAFILLDKSPTYSPPRIGELVAIRHPTRVRPSSATSPPAIATLPANLTRLGLAIDLAACTSLGCLNYVPSTSSSRSLSALARDGAALCEIHVMAQVHKSLNKRMELSGASTAPIMVRSGVGKDATVRYVKEVIASAAGGRGGRDAGGAGTSSGECTYYMREKVLVTHPRAETGVKENPRRKEAIDAILQKDNSPGAQNLRRVRQLADPTNDNLFEGDLASKERKRQDNARVVAGLDLLNDARKRQRELREDKAAALAAAAGAAARGAHAKIRAREEAVKATKETSEEGTVGMKTASSEAGGGDMIMLSDSSDDET